MLTIRPPRIRAALAAIFPLGLLAGPAFGHHAMGGRAPETPLEAALSDAVHFLLDLGPMALVAGTTLIIAIAAAVAARRSHRRRPWSVTVLARGSRAFMMAGAAVLAAPFLLSSFPLS